MQSMQWRSDMFWYLLIHVWNISEIFSESLRLCAGLARGQEPGSQVLTSPMTGAGTLLVYHHHYHVGQDLVKLVIVHITSLTHSSSSSSSSVAAQYRSLIFFFLSVPSFMVSSLNYREKLVGDKTAKLSSIWTEGRLWERMWRVQMLYWGQYS